MSSKYSFNPDTTSSLRVIIVFFVYHPNITDGTSKLIICQELNPGEYWLAVDYDQRCYQGLHRFVVLAFVMPVLILGVVGGPLLILFRLKKNEKRNTDDNHDKDGSSGAPNQLK